MAKLTVSRRFDRRAQEMLKEAKARGEPVYGAKPWYCSASIIERGAEVAFIGANPGGGPQSEAEDARLGYHKRPYDDHRYNAWLDDRHWEGDGRGHQQRAVEAFEILFGSQGRNILRRAACFNVVPLPTGGVDKLVQVTWDEGVDWTIAVLEHVAPDVVVCNGNGSSGKSAWNALDMGFGITGLEERVLYNRYRLKVGHIARGKLAGADVIGLPHLARMKSIPKLRAEASLLGFPDRVSVERKSG